MMRCAAWILACLCMGCAAGRVQQVYDGPRLPLTEAAWLEVPACMVLLEVNGKALVKGRFNQGGGTYELRPGRQQLVVRYDDVWPAGEYDQERVLSAPLTLTTDFTAGEQYYIGYDQPASLNEARALALALFAEVRQKQVIAAAAAVPAVAVRTQPGSRTDVAPAGGTPAAAAVPVVSPLDELLHWWGRASAEQRELFLQKVGR